MGCGTSSVSDEKAVSNTSLQGNRTEGGNNNKENGHIPNGEAPKANGHVGSSASPKKSPSKQQPVTAGGDASPSAPPPSQTPVPKAVAFDVTFDNKNIDHILNKHPPKRLKGLAPLENVPKLTADMLAEKQRQVEENRQKELEKVRQTSRRSHKLRQQVMQAREFEKAQHQYQEIEGKLESAGKNREAKRLEMEQKRRMREERAKKARERAQRIKQQGDEDLDFEVEKDDRFNADDGDSWLDDDTATVTTELSDRMLSAGERIYSGRESPKKNYNPRSSAELRARMSAGTTDSFDYAFQRNPAISRDPSKVDDFFDRDPNSDDFFDS